MWPFTKKNTEVKAIVVVNKDLHEPIDYCNKIDVDIKTEIRAACNQLALNANEDEVLRISKSLESGHGYLYIDLDGSEYGFDIITIKI